MNRLKVAQWNIMRDNNNFNKELELRLLNEEADEFKIAVMLYTQSANKTARTLALVDMIDAMCDFEFVLNGTKFKYLGSDKKFDFQTQETILDYMESILIRDLDIPFGILAESRKAVIKANEAKGTEKVDGKIQKGDLWVDPKDIIKTLLEINDVV